MFENYLRLGRYTTDGKAAPGDRLYDDWTGLRRSFGVCAENWNLSSNKKGFILGSYTDISPVIIVFMRSQDVDCFFLWLESTNFTQWRVLSSGTSRNNRQRACPYSRRWILWAAILPPPYRATAQAARGAIQASSLATAFSLLIPQSAPAADIFGSGFLVLTCKFEFLSILRSIFRFRLKCSDFLRIHGGNSIGNLSVWSLSGGVGRSAVSRQLVALE
jgi:hypothetical protein